MNYFTFTESKVFDFHNHLIDEKICKSKMMNDVPELCR